MNTTTCAEPKVQRWVPLGPALPRALSLNSQGRHPGSLAFPSAVCWPFYFHACSLCSRQARRRQARPDYSISGFDRGELQRGSRPREGAWNGLEGMKSNGSPNQTLVRIFWCHLPLPLTALVLTCVWQMCLLPLSESHGFTSDSVVSPYKAFQRADRFICSFVSLYYREGVVEALCRPAAVWWPQQRGTGVH